MVRGVVFPSKPETGSGTDSRPSPSPTSSTNPKSTPTNVIDKRRNKFGSVDTPPAPARFSDRGRGYRFAGRGGRGAGPGRGAGRGYRGRGRPRYTNKTLIVNGGGRGGAGRSNVSKESLDHDLDSYFNQSDNKNTDDSSTPTNKSTIQ